MKRLSVIATIAALALIVTACGKENGAATNEKARRSVYPSTTAKSLPKSCCSWRRISRKPVSTTAISRSITTK